MVIQQGSQRTIVDNIHISHSTIVMHLKCGGIFNNSFISNSPCSVVVESYKTQKLCQDLAKIWTEVWHNVFDS